MSSIRQGERILKKKRDLRAHARTHVRCMHRWVKRSLKMDS